MKAWKKYTGYDQWDQSSARQAKFHPGPLYTSDLFVGETPIVTAMLWLYICCLDFYLPDIENERLKEHLMEEVDYSLIPEAGWKKLVEWYGMAPGSIPIARKVVKYGKHAKVEVYRMEFKLVMHPKLTETTVQDFSRSDTVGECVLCQLDINYMYTFISRGGWKRNNYVMCIPYGAYISRV